MQKGTVEIEKVAEVCLETEKVRLKGRSKTIILGENDIQDIRIALEFGQVHLSIQQGCVNVTVFDGTPEIVGKMDITSNGWLAIDAEVDGERTHFGDRKAP